MHAHQGKTIETSCDSFHLRPFSKLGIPRKGKNAKICKHINGQLLKQVVILFNCAFFSKLGTPLKGHNLERIMSLKCSPSRYGKTRTQNR